MTVEVRVPTLPESVADAVLLNWVKKAGDRVERDEILTELETDKVVLEIPAPVSGVLSVIVEPIGATVTAQQIIARIEPNEKETTTEQPASAEIETPPAVEQQAETPAHDAVDAQLSSEAPPAVEQQVETPVHETVDAQSSSATPPATSLNDGEELTSPAVRRLATEMAIDIKTISGTGRNGRITKEDILNHISQIVTPQQSTDGEIARDTVEQTTAQSDENADTRNNTTDNTTDNTATMSLQREERRTPMSRLRQTIAKRLIDSQQNAALLTTFNEVNMQQIIDLRTRHKKNFVEKHSSRLGFMSFFVKASALALQRYPLVNAHIDGTDVIEHNYVDISIAVSSPRGLVVPVLRNCEALDYAQIERKIEDFSERAKQGKITIDELTGGTFTITNGGIFGSLLSTPIVNPPQSAILGMHTIQQRAVVEDETIVIRPMMYLALSYDHRMVDGKDAVQFLVDIKKSLEDPSKMLLDC